MRFAVLVNAAAGSRSGSGADDAVGRVRDAVTAAGLDAEVHGVQPERLNAEATRLADGVDALVVAGGDGTVGTVAAAAVAAGKRFGVLPLGTFNHFAKDLGLPLDLDAAVEVLAAAHSRRIDVGEVNDRVFVNNSSIGLYPAAVEERDEQRHRLGRPKMLAMAHASLNALRRCPTYALVLDEDGHRRRVETPFVFVANNPYDVSLFAIGRRASLDAGVLEVYAAEDTGSLGLLVLMGRALLGRLHGSPRLRTRTLEELEIDARDRSLCVALDGEVQRLAAPLRYRIRPGVLDVLVPAPEAAA